MDFQAEETMKILVRLCWIIVIATYATLMSFEKSLMKEELSGLSFFIVGAGAIAGLVLLVSLLYHWFKTRFNHRVWKIFWLVALFFYPYMVGPIAYYLTVFELGKTVRKE